MKNYTVTIINGETGADIRTVNVGAEKSMEAHKKALLRHCKEDEHISLINDNFGNECYVSGMGFQSYE